MSSSPIEAQNKSNNRTPFVHPGKVGAPLWQWDGESRSSLLPNVAICHLQWDWVWQRPQQFLSRLAQNRPVLFVETHRTNTWNSFVKVRDCKSAKNVTIMEIHLPDDRWDDGHFIDNERLRVVKEALKYENLKHFAEGILWFNDPIAVTAYAGHLNEALIVYDCMDELTQF